MDPAYCLDRAEECEWLAREAVSEMLSRELRLMAADWRAAATANDDPKSEARSGQNDGAG